MLLSFALWAEYGLVQSIKNVVELQRAAPPDIKNPVLTFVVPRAMNHVVEQSVLEVHQAWELLNKELKRLGLRTLGTSHKDYKHLRRIRNKLVAHRIENVLKTSRHLSWYKRTYGTYDSVLELAARAAHRVVDRIKKLEQSGRIFADSVSANSAPIVTRQDIRSLLEAAKAHGIY